MVCTGTIMTRITHGVSTRRPKSNFDLVAECDENSVNEAAYGSPPAFIDGMMKWLLEDIYWEDVGYWDDTELWTE